MTTSSDQYFKRHKRQSRPSKQYKSRIDVLILRQYLKKDFFVEKKKNGERKGGKYLEKEKKEHIIETEKLLRVDGTGLKGSLRNL